ncbi:hypothetical protein AB0H83_39505 [Dactylosporangium sp. NPDC050688]|uniref:hypothetical protein n=1 Tax=Dactylosporangium sp. NPDC050688 TaxID=3157217 RepID=UPI0033FC9E9E
MAARAAAALHDVAALWSAGLAWPAGVVRAACAVLPDGGDSLAMLAGLPEATADDTDVEPLLEAALAEVGLAYHPPGSATVLDHAVTAKARELLAGTITAQALARWAYQVNGLNQIPALEPFGLLHASYGYEPGDPNPLDDDVYAEARALIARADRRP